MTRISRLIFSLSLGFFILACGGGGMPNSSDVFISEAISSIETKVSAVTAAVLLIAMN